MSFSLRLFLSLLLTPFLVSAAHAITLDWDTVTWTPGSLSNSYDVDPTKPGNDISVNITGDTGQFAPKGGSTIPAIMNIIEGGLTPVQNALVLHLDLANQSQFVTVTVNFSASYTLGVNNVSFTIFDVDFASSAFQDQLSSITALSIDGTTLVAPTITTSSGNSLSGSGLNQIVTGLNNNPDTGAGSDSGNVTISFGATAIKSFTFTYGSGATAPADPSTQGIALHDITFTPVPELNPAWSGLAACLVAIGLAFRHHANVRRK
ncbi:MAG: hypothetical protein DLM73_09465 [Chthoniobacterales bacterium]|nr:MAG: hypothetical protein DLM73_09465 [Chthoniobacterales bacterium]